MKKFLIPVLSLFSAAALAQETATAPTLKVGSTVSLEPVTSAKWIQGEPLKAFEPGKIYIFECWAVWCGPCVAAIPHVNDLHKKYASKGLRVIGMNVWEDGEEKVAKFVKDKGEGMSYPVAYTGKGSDFEKEWLKAAGVRGIPHAFVVKDGKIVLMTHPMSLTENIIEALLSSDEAGKKVIEQMNAKQELQTKTEGVLREFALAGRKGDTGAMGEILARIEKEFPKADFLTSLKIELAVAKQDWAGASGLISGDSPDSGRDKAITTLTHEVGLIGTKTNFPPEFVKALARASAKRMENSKNSSPYDYLSLSSLQWRAGDKATALASARKAVDAQSQPKNNKFPAEPLKRFVKSLEADQLPTLAELRKWMTESAVQEAARTAPQKKADSKGN